MLEYSINRRGARTFDVILLVSTVNGIRTYMPVRTFKSELEALNYIQTYTRVSLLS